MPDLLKRHNRYDADNIASARVAMDRWSEFRNDPVWSVLVPKYVARLGSAEDKRRLDALQRQEGQSA